MMLSGDTVMYRCSSPSEQLEPALRMYRSPTGQLVNNAVTIGPQGEPFTKWHSFALKPFLFTE